MVSTLTRPSRVALVVLVSSCFWTAPSAAQQAVHVLPQKNHVAYVAFSPDSKVLATQSFEGINFWDVQKGKLQGGVKSATINASEFAFTPDGKRLVGTATQESVAVWNVATGRVEKVLPFPNTIYTLSVSPNGKTIVSSTGGKTIQIHELATGKEVLKIFPAHGRSIQCVSFSSNGSLLASIGRPEGIKIWNANTGECIVTIPHPPGYIYWYRLAFSPDGTKLASAGSGYRISDARTGKDIVNALSKDTVFRAVTFSADGRWIATGGNDNEVSIVDAESGKVVKTLRGHERDIGALAFSRDGKYLASGSSDRTVRIWDLKQAK